MATPEGLEPPTLGSEDQCSIQLSYGAAWVTNMLAQFLLEQLSFYSDLAPRVLKHRQTSSQESLPSFLTKGVLPVGISAMSMLLHRLPAERGNRPFCTTSS